MWTRLQQQQQRGAQIDSRRRASGEAPDEATRDRAAQDHDYADLDVSEGEPRRGDYPATNPPEREGDITPDAPDPEVDWDDVVQPERAERDDEGA